MAEVLSSNFSVPGQHKEEEQVDSGRRIHIQASSDDGSRNLHIRTRADRSSEEEESTAGALVVHSGGDLTPKGEDQPQDMLTELLAELGRIETQQDKLRDAVKHNRGIVVHPRQEVLEEESEHGDTPKAPTPKKKIIVSGGLTGFGIAQDLLQIDFSPPEEAPEEFKAVAFFEEPKQIKPGLSGSFGLCDPASKEMHHYLERLEEQQKLVLELITGKKQALLEQYASQGASRSKGGKKRAVKSRLAQSGRLEETANKTAVANALGLSAADKLASVGGKLGSMALGGKGALASKLPMALSTGAKPDPVSAARPVIKERAVPPQVRQARQAPARKAEVQKEDADAKEQEEMRALFAKPLPGSTPSTSHLAGKSAAKESHAAAVEAAEAQANPYYSRSPQKAVPTPVAVPATPGGRVSTLAPEAAAPPAVDADNAKPGMLRGFKKMFSKNKA